jgi:tripartite-type tricarboxylate transporter receptor subunit TctC
VSCCLIGTLFLFKGKNMFIITHWITRFFLVLCLTISSAMSQEHRTVVTFPAGSQTDIIARSMSTVFFQHTGQKLLIENIPGAETLIGTTRWRNQAMPIIFTSSAQMIWNIVQNLDLPYKDSDFDHIIYLGSTPAIWIVNADTPIRDLQDLVKSKNTRIGGYAPNYNENFVSLQRKFNTSAILVNYKGAPQVLNDVVAGHIEAGLIPVTPGLIAFVNQGKVRMIGSSYHKEIRIGDYLIPSVPKTLGVDGFSGFVGIALNPTLSKEQAEFLRKNLWLSFQGESVQKLVKDLNFLPDASNDPKWIADHYSRSRANIRANLTK